MRPRGCSFVPSLPNRTRRSRVVRCAASMVAMRSGTRPRHLAQFGPPLGRWPAAVSTRIVLMIYRSAVHARQRHGGTRHRPTRVVPFNSSIANVDNCRPWSVRCWIYPLPRHNSLLHRSPYRCHLLDETTWWDDHYLRPCCHPSSSCARPNRPPPFPRSSFAAPSPSSARCCIS